ncbi:MAG: hypothetical protein ACW975_03640 [Candidatus Thorarchaeota archaeon]|jgi:hypothetical protein
MSQEIPNYAKYIFLFSFIVSLIFGVWYFFSPESWSDITAWPTETAAGRVVGALQLMLAIGAILAYRATSWKEVELYVLMAIVGNLLSAIGMVWNMLVLTLPIVGWLLTGLLVLFLVLYFYVYYQCK